VLTNGENNKLDSVDVKVTFKVNPMIHNDVDASSRALSATNEEAVLDVYVLIFNNQGYLVGRKYVDGSPTSVTVPTRVSPAGDASTTVYCFANTHDATYFNGTASLSSLQTKCQTLAKTYADVNALNAETSIIMYGSKTIGAIVDPITVTDVPLLRAMSKLHFNIGVKSGSDIKIDGYQLMNVPLSCYVTDDVTKDKTVDTHPDGTAYADMAKVAVNVTSQELLYYIPSSYAGNGLAGSISYETRYKSYAPTNATYLRIWAHSAINKWESHVDIYIGGKTNTDFQDYNIYRNFAYDYTITINGSGMNDFRVTVGGMPKIGDFYYTDGTFSTALNTSKTVVGIVFENDVTRMNPVEVALGYYHGYVMAIKNAGSATWGPSTDSSLPNISNCAQAYADVSSGYYATVTLGWGTNSVYPAFKLARSFASPAAPATTTGWYLPSAGQWWSIQEKLGLCSSLSTYHNSTDQYFNLTTSSLEAKQVLGVLNNYMTQVSGTAFDTNWYSSASEKDATQYCPISISGSSAVLINGSWPGLYKNGGPVIRPVLAF
jgi:hypothetical protein